MLSSFTEIQTFDKWWHYALAGFLVIVITCCNLGIWVSGITKNYIKEPLTFLILISILHITTKKEQKKSFTTIFKNYTRGNYLY